MLLFVTNVTFNSGGSHVSIVSRGITVRVPSAITPWPNANTATASIPIPGAAEQPRFNPVDGFMYLTIPRVGVLVFDPNAGAAGTGAVAATFPLSNCSGNGNWIDAVTDTMLVGCNNVAGLAIVNLVDGSVLARFPRANRDDVIGYKPGIRCWYSASGSNTNNSGKCPATNTGTTFPIVGVFAAGTAGAPSGTMVGAVCSGAKRLDAGRGPDSPERIRTGCTISPGPGEQQHGEAKGDGVL